MSSFMISSLSNPQLSSSEPKWSYDVFYSSMLEPFFFPFSLKASLTAAEIKIFIDSDEDHEEEITPSLLSAIEGSRISIVFFTKEYVDSRRRLQKLEKIMECHRSMGQMVLPVYYDVKPWEVRQQSGRFGEAFEGLMERMCVRKDKELKWRRELAEATLLPGWEWSSSRNYGIFIDMVDSIKRILDNSSLFITRHPVGVERRVVEVLRLCNFGETVRIVGISGGGGIGKTTIAKAIYNEISCRFERSCFLANIKDEWEKDNGQVYLQEQLISHISNANDVQIHDTEMGIRQMKVLLRNKKALVVLDDVSKIDQLKALCGSREWFGVGSVVFITTRDLRLLRQFKVDFAYKMKNMDKSECLELFSWHAFEYASPPNDFIDLSRKAIAYCGGLPLALEVLGSLLLDKTRPEWDILFKKLPRSNFSAVPNVLKLSYEYLENSEKDIFLDIARFYVGKDRQYVTEILNDCGFCGEVAVSVLIMRSLVKVDKSNKLEMHDYFQEMGRGTNPYKKKPKYIYDVFLSFRGEETRKAFASHLCATLRNAGIEVFMDDRLKRGENISSSLLQAIEGSRISIIIFSADYAGSRWCLQELEKIMECRRNTGQEVLPIFYGVQPSDVRRQMGTFGKALEELSMRISASKEKIVSWRRALTEAANISGWDSHSYRTEIDLINHIFESVTMKLDDNAYLFVTNHPVGVKSRAQEIIKLLSGKSNEVIIVGIWGMAGIGKTTIATVIYNEIGRKFESKSFLGNIREHWKQDKGQVDLQEQLLSGILKGKKRKLHNIGLGKTIMKERLCHTRALVVLDDVDKLDQLSALCGSREWFGRGSRIIITTRDEHLLNVLQVDNVYNIKELDDYESLELFSWHAFKQATPIEDFVELSRRVIAYSGGLPLALEVLGSYLFDRAILAWESVLQKLQEIPNDRIHEKLKISYDGLSDHMEKDIFLDICCFFIGKDRNYVTQILNGCGLHAEIGITRLIERSLVKVNKNNKFEMHDLLRLMGREIIREKSPDEPEKRTRLWVHDEVLDVLMTNTGSIAVKGLALNLSRNNELCLKTKAFKKMKRLKLLQLGHVKLAGDYEYLSKDLRWLCWHGFPLRYMPEDFYLKNLVAMDLKYSNLTQVWKGSQLLERLKILNLSHSHHLTRTPEFSELPNLEKLILKDCPCLSMVHPTIGDLKYLILLNLKDCKELSHLPRSLYKLKSLKIFILSGCSKIGKLEEDIEQMESLTTLMADNTAITQVPFPLVRSKSIKYVSLCGCEGLTRDVFPPLIWSLMSPANNPKSLIQAFVSMPFLLRGLSHGLFARSSPKLETVPSTSQISRTKGSALIGFHDYVHHIQGSTDFLSSLIIQMGDFNKVNDTLLESILQGGSERLFDDCSLPGDNYPVWLTFKGEESSVLFQVPQVICRSVKGMILCIVYFCNQDSMTSVYPVSVLIKNYTKAATIEFYKRDELTTSGDEEWQSILSKLEPDHEVEVIVTFEHKFTVKKTIIYLIYGED